MNKYMKSGSQVSRDISHNSQVHKKGATNPGVCEAGCDLSNSKM